MTCIFPHATWVVLLTALVAGCIDPVEPSTGLDVAERPQQYLPQQGRLVQGFKAPDARKFLIPGAKVVNGELFIGDLRGDAIQKTQLVAVHNGTSITMRIAQAYKPDATEPRWNYLLEQRNAAGAWEPACQEANPVVPPTQLLPTPIRAIAMPGEWDNHVYRFAPEHVTFACRTGVAAKCDGWGYSATMQWPNVTDTGIANTATGPDMMQACTQMARADYCGSGAPNTLEGTPVWIEDAFTPDEPANSSFPFEAAWAGSAADDKPWVQTPVVCLSKKRWSTLPLGGDCPDKVPDPRVTKANFCDDMKPSEMEALGARIYSSSSFIDAALYTHLDADGMRFTTTYLLPTKQSQPPAWHTIADPTGGRFPSSTQPGSLEATIFRYPPVPSLDTTALVALASYWCGTYGVTSPRAPLDPKCNKVETEGFLYPAGTPGRAVLRRWYKPGKLESHTTAISPTQMLAKGWNLAEVLGGVVRASVDVNVRWSSLAGYSYQLDVQTRGGEWITPCMTSAHIGATPQATYRGVCPGAHDRLVHHADIAAFRVTYTKSGSPTYVALRSYDGFSTDTYVALTAPGSTTTALAVTWNDVGGGAKYQLSVQNLGADWIQCANENVLATEPAYLHTGKCWSANNTLVRVRDITQLRVCAVGSAGQSLGCSAKVAYNGVSPQVSLTIAAPM